MRERKKEMRIGNIEIANGAALAPMAGDGDYALRCLCAGYGAVFTISEMVSAKALVMGDQKSFQLLRGRGGTVPYGVQIFGEDPEIMAQATKKMAREDFDFLDINMGCPAPKIVGHGAGSALLKNPVLAGEIARAVVQASERPVTVKMRIGWDEDTLTGIEVAKRCEQAGVKMLAVHARTRAQQYTPGVRYEVVAEIKKAVSIPVLVNGDIVDAPSALLALEQTACDGAMIGRMAMGAPWVFAEVDAAMNGKEIPQTPTLREKLHILQRHIEEMCQDKGEDVAMRQARGVAAQYMRGLRGAATLRRQAVSLTYFTDLGDLIEHALELQNPANTNNEEDDPLWL